MPYCPKCKHEHRAALLICPDCQEPLVDRLEPAGTAAVVPDDSWVVVGGVSSELQSHMAKGSLDSNNIPSMVLPSSFTRHLTGFGVPAGEREEEAGKEVILVPREFLEEASLVLDAALGEDLDQAGSEQDQG